MTEVITKSQINRILERIGMMVKEDAIRRAPVDTSDLRRQIDYVVEGNSVTISATSDHADFVEYGTGIYHIDEEGQPEPHTGWDIVPVNKKALAWGKVIGKSPSGATTREHVAKKVHIEGMRPQPFLRPAVHQNIPRMKEIIREELTKK